MFSISDKVVCVNAKNLPVEDLAVLPVEGKVYVVRGLDTSPTANPISPELYLVGIFGATWWDGSERPFAPQRFRKLTDIQAENALRNAEPILTNNGGVEHSY